MLTKTDTIIYPTGPHVGFDFKSIELFFFQLTCVSLLLLRHTNFFFLSC